VKRHFRSRPLLSFVIRPLRLLAVSVVLLPLFSFAQSLAPPSPGTPAPEALPASGASLRTGPSTSEEDSPSQDERLQQLEERLADLEARLSQANARTSVKPRAPLTFSGHADLGFFVPFGTGAGVVQDYGGEHAGALKGQYGWIFLGDLLATPVNTRGDAADLGDLPGVQRFDPIHARGAPGFLVNEVNLRATAGLSDNVLLTTSVDFMPRSGANFALGDYFEVDLAQLEWLPFEDGKTSLFVGKFESVVGIEYKERKAPARFGITPTLLERYTSGTPLGLKARTKLLDDHLILAASLTNGSSSTEQFHFYSETDTNWGKTASGRVAFRLPVWGTWELGVSGLLGAQDHASDSAGLMWLWGVDFQYTSGNFTFKAQYLRGGQPGKAEEGVYGLRLNTGAYAEANWLITPVFGVLLRGELRDALVWLGTERAYLTKSWRGVAGLRFSFNEHITLKAEYLRNGEYGGLPEIRNDLFTSSLVLAY